MKEDIIGLMMEDHGETLIDKMTIVEMTGFISIPMEPVK